MFYYVLTEDSISILYFYTTALTKRELTLKNKGKYPTYNHYKGDTTVLFLLLVYENRISPNQNENHFQESCRYYLLACRLEPGATLIACLFAYYCKY